MNEDDVIARLERIEAKLDVLITYLVEEEVAATDLEGNPIPPERDENQML